MLKRAGQSERSKIDLGELPWAKEWREEVRPTLLLADAIQISDSDTFRLIRKGDPVDAEICIDKEIIPLQITVADPDWKNDGKGGYLRRLEIEKLSQDGHCFGGGDISRGDDGEIENDPRAYSPAERLEALAAELTKALQRKTQRDNKGVSLVIFARGFYPNLLDEGFEVAIRRMVTQVGIGNFKKVYVVDAYAGAFVVIEPQK